MHPAISVIFFTVTSGAGFGLLAFIGMGIPMPSDGIWAFIAAFIGGGLAVAGLISSTFHLGHPERAWRAFSQWRSSWLSREGVCAVATLLAFGFYTLFWVFFGNRIEWLGWLVAVGSVLTVFTTSMIYAQLKTIPKWNNWITPVCYLLFSLLSGSLLAACFGYWQKIGIFPVAFLGLALLASSWGAKLFWWSRGDTLEERGSSTGTATGLGKIGNVKLFERPHSGENYLTREMVHKIGRKHAAKIRVIALLFGAILPAIFCLIAMIGSSIAPFLFVLAFVCLMAGLFAERWLFFAEAKHAVSLYYD